MKQLPGTQEIARDPHTKETLTNLLLIQCNIRQLDYSAARKESRREVEIEIVESGHLRPLAATRLELAGAATCDHLRPLAGSGHLRPLAATCLELAGAATCGHLRPLAWNWLERPLAATCGHSLGAATCGHLRPLAGSGHLRPLEWLPVAAKGRALPEMHGRLEILKSNGFAGKAVFFSSLEGG
eukprot:s1457_g6.t1